MNRGITDIPIHLSCVTEAYYNNDIGCTQEFLFFVTYETSFIIIFLAEAACDSEKDFQICLNNFVDYCKLWKLNINYEKTKIIIFGVRKTEKYCFKMDGNIIHPAGDVLWVFVEPGNVGP